eukprot:scaffold34623_cov274-Amphora_coffeaeformis.AAC.3
MCGHEEDDEVFVAVLVDVVFVFAVVTVVLGGALIRIVAELPFASFSCPMTVSIMPPSPFGGNDGTPTAIIKPSEVEEGVTSKKRTKIPSPNRTDTRGTYRALRCSTKRSSSERFRRTPRRRGGGDNEGEGDDLMRMMMLCLLSRSVCCCCCWCCAIYCTAPCVVSGLTMSEFCRDAQPDYLFWLGMSRK